MKTALALSLFLFTSSALAAVIGKDVNYKAGEATMKGFVGWVMSYLFREVEHRALWNERGR